MAALSESSKGITRPAQVRQIEGHHLGRDASDQSIESVAGLQSSAPFSGDGGFEERCCRDDFSAGSIEALSERRGVGFTEDDGEQC